jgi:hypothetical protein
LIVIAFIFTMTNNEAWSQNDIVVDISKLEINSIYMGNDSVEKFESVLGKYDYMRRGAFEGNITYAKFKKCVELYFKNDLLSNLIIVNNCENIKIRMNGENIFWGSNKLDIIKQIERQGIQYTINDEDESLLINIQNKDDLMLLLYFKSNLLAKIKVIRRLI